MINKLIIINNEKVSKKENKFYCHNIDMKSIPEGLSKNFELYTIVRKSKINQPHQICFDKISIASNIFTFLYYIFKTLKFKKANYLLISVTPYTFIAYLLLFIFRKKIYVYFRSDGYEEYKAIFGFIGPLIYHFMYIFVTFKSNIITCQRRLIKKKKSDLVSPSQLDANWLKRTEKSPLNKPKLLYVGRVKVEKGIFSLLQIFNEITINAELSIVGKVDEDQKKRISNIGDLSQKEKINFIGYGFETSKLIDIYDNHNIFILPSFTEGHPQVIDESLARARPVIIFEDIKHIIQNRIGIFVSARNANALSKTIELIMSNYLDIQEKMKKNKLPTRQEFISQITQILS